MRKCFILLLFVIVFLTFPKSSFAAAPLLHVHSFQTSGDSAYDEFVSISNDGPTSIDLTNYSVSRKSKTATSWNTLYKFTGTVIAPGQVLVIGHSKYTGVADFIYSTTSSLTAEDNSIAIIAADKSIADLVGYGEPNSFEGTPLPNPASGEIYTRFQDTGNNLTDFSSSMKVVSLDPNASRVVISELMPAPSEGKEWFELFNPTSQTVSISGLKICDAIGSIHCYYFPQSEVLNPFEYRTYGQDVTKITLNNTGDWLELRDGDDNLIADSGGDYGNADADISLSLFGSEFMWTKTPTPGAQNYFTDTVEIEAAVSKAPKSTSKAVKTVSKSTTVKVVDDSASPDGQSQSTDDGKVASKSASTNQGIISSSNKMLGYALISLAVLLLVGYNLWEKRDYARKLYDQIRRRDS